MAEQKLVAAHKAFLSTPGLQRDFPAVEPPKPPPAWFRVIGEIIEALLPLLKYVFWGGLILAGLLIAVLVIREILDSRRPQRRAAAAVTDWRPSAETARALLDDADKLAAEGRFDEAAHVLLFRSIEDLNRRRPGVVRPALTSRDIAALAALPHGARTAFEGIAQAVERSFFGGRAMTADDFAGCRRAYEAYASAEAWT